jgi:uroporphyrinogen-III synthase
MTDSQQTEQLRTKAKQFAIGILKLFGSLPKTPETHAIEAPLAKAATTLAADCRALARAWSEDDFLTKRGVAAADADDCVFWLELLSAAASDHEQSIHVLLEDVADIVALLSICGDSDQPGSPTASAGASPIPVISEPPPPPLPTDFHGLRVVSFESRMAPEMTRLIERNGGTPVVVPALRELQIPLQENGAVFRLGVKLILEQIDVVILLTGIGTTILFDLLQTRYPLTDLVESLKKTIVVTRGPKPLAALKKILDLEPNITVPEPNTWVEVVSTLDEYRPVKGLRVAVQEYGMSNPQLLEALRQRGAEVFPVPIYRWALPEDTGPLKQVLGEIIAGNMQVMLITNAAQIDHVMQLLEQEGTTAQFKEACRKMVVASIGPTASECLRHYDLPIDFEPSHPKMGVLVKETSERVHSLLQSRLPKATP